MCLCIALRLPNSWRHVAHFNLNRSAELKSGVSVFCVRGSSVGVDAGLLVPWAVTTCGWSVCCVLGSSGGFSALLLAGVAAGGALAGAAELDAAEPIAPLALGPAVVAPAVPLALELDGIASAGWLPVCACVADGVGTPTAGAGGGSVPASLVGLG